VTKGDEVRRLREAAGLTLEAVSEVAGITMGYLSLLERGLRPLSVDMFTALAQSVQGLRDQRDADYNAALVETGFRPGAKVVPA